VGNWKTLVKRYTVLSEPRMKAVLKIQACILKAWREFLSEKGFMEIRAPIVEPYSDPGLRGAELVSIDLAGKKHVVMSAFTLHKHVVSSYLGKIFALAPCIRDEPEKSKTSGRHLVEFYQLEVEASGIDYRKAMGYAEELVAYIVKSVKERCSTELKLLGRELIVPSLPFKKITHAEAVGIAKKMGFDLKGKELSWEAEKAISEMFKEPFFIVEYPKGSRGFYDRDGEQTLLDFDLMYPEGFGEACSGGEREWDYTRAVKKLEKIDKPEKYRCYLEMLKRKKLRTAGFGIGLERLTRFICGLGDVKDACLFAKTPGGKH